MLSASFLRNYTSHDCDFTDAGVKWWYIQGSFSFLFFFFFFCFFFCFCFFKKIFFFFCFFFCFCFFQKFWFFGPKLGKRHKWPKMTCNAIHIIFCELNIMWLRFLVHWCKMMITPGIFFIFQKFWFFWTKKYGKGKERLK